MKGRARFVSDPQDGANIIEHGDVLICSTTDPAWTMLFAKVSAVVTEHGGILSHAAITAREMRVPCICGVGNIMSKREDLDGKQVIVDLKTGELYSE